MGSGLESRHFSRRGTAVPDRDGIAQGWPVRRLGNCRLAEHGVRKQPLATGVKRRGTAWLPNLTNPETNVILTARGSWQRSAFRRARGPGSDRDGLTCGALLERCLCRLGSRSRGGRPWRGAVGVRRGGGQVLNSQVLHDPALPIRKVSDRAKRMDSRPDPTRTPRGPRADPTRHGTPDAPRGKGTTRATAMGESTSAGPVWCPAEC
jgi:hypothetical protein